MRALLLAALLGATARAQDGTTCVACGLIFTLLEQGNGTVLPTGASPDESCKALGFCSGKCSLYGPGNAWPVASPIIMSDGGVNDQRRRLAASARAGGAPLPTKEDAVAFLEELASLPAGAVPPTRLWPLVVAFVARGAGAAARAAAAAAAAPPPPCDIFNVSCDITRFADDHLPLFDGDDDSFGADSAGFRGTSWRGKDCDDSSAAVRPGRRHAAGNASVDDNCNGISGGNASIPDFEAAFCSGANAPMSVVILGDSATAHFHIPGQYVNVRQLAAGALSNLTNLVDLLANEAGWPQCSWSTGYRTTEECPTVTALAPMNSIYQRLRAQNLCNHRQFANIGVNGARVTSMSPPGGIIESFTPDAALDAPSLVIHALIGNDVCNGHPGTSAMTTVEEFQAAVLASLDYLDANLPAGSHVAFLGLVDGRILFDTTKSRIHPLGVTYPALYDYLACTGSSPCLGWLNTNKTMRNITSERAANLTAVYDEIIAVNGSAYKNFDLYRLQVDWPELIANYTAHGGDAINVIEPVDGFHPSQEGNQLLAGVLWDDLAANKPSWLPAANPYNPAIAQLFGAQLNGY